MSTVQNSQNLQTFFEDGKQTKFAPKEKILHTETSEELSYYFVASGFVKVVSYLKSGNERIHYIYGPNDIFPSQWKPAMPYQKTTFVAMNGVVLRKKSAAAFDEYIHSAHFSLSELQPILFKMHDRIYNLNLETVEERIAHCLVTFALRYGERDGVYYILDKILTEQEFADVVRASLEDTVKALNMFEDKKYLISTNKRLMLNVFQLMKALNRQ